MISKLLKTFEWISNFTAVLRSTGRYDEIIGNLLEYSICNTLQAVSATTQKINSS